MSAQDRRSGRERRGTTRFQIELDVEWETSKGRFPGSVSDVNLDGCFVLCSGDVSDDEYVSVYLPMSDGMKAQFGGRVANHVFDIGFGIKFDQLSSLQRDLLVEIVRDFEKT
jgi:hypothetical protein